jgi:hypothetical protein
MGKRDRAKKDVKRLQLRREVIRILAGDSLKQVQGGWGTGGIGRQVDETCGPSDSLCQPSKGTGILP